MFDYVIQFGTYHPYYKEKLFNNLTWFFICIISYSYFKYGLGSLKNLLMTSLFICNSGVCITKPGLITKKRELLKTFIYFFSPFPTFISLI